MAETYYCVLSDVHSICGIATSDTAKDTLITSYLPIAWKAINNYLDRELRQRTYTEYVDGTAKPYFFTRNYPIISVTSIADDWDARTGAGVTTLASADFVIYKDEGKILLDPQGGAPIEKFCSVPLGIKAVYVAGYATIPQDIQMAAALLIAFWAGIRTRTITTGDGLVMSVTVTPGEIPPEIRKILDPHKRQALGMWSGQSTDSTT